MTGPGRVNEERPGFDAEEEPLVGLYEIGPDDELDEADLEGIADIEAGRTVSNAAVMRWIKSWGTENELPPPQCGE